MKHEWTKTEVANLLGISPRTVHFYTDEKLLTPGISNPTGKGTTRKYSATNLVEFAVIAELAKCGLALAEIKSVMSVGKILPSKGPHPWNPEAIAPDGRYFIVLYNSHEPDGTLVLTATKRDVFTLPLTFGPSSESAMRKKPFTSAVVVDITSITDRIRKALQ